MANHFNDPKKNSHVDCHLSLWDVTLTRMCFKILGLISTAYSC